MGRGILTLLRMQALALLLAAGAACGPGATPERPGSPRPGDRTELLFIWEGRVDGRDTLKFRGRECLLEHEAHLPVERMKFQSIQPIDPTAYPVKIVLEQGRGRVEVIRQGDEFNAWTLLVRVDDLHIGGAGLYRFSAYRDRPRRPERPILSVFAEVDDEAVLEVSGRRVVPRPEGGTGVLALKYDFPGSRSVRDGERYELRTVRGRGEVSLVPAVSPGAPLGIRILDKGKGSSVYIVELLPDRGARDF